MHLAHRLILCLIAAAAWLHFGPVPTPASAANQVQCACAAAELSCCCGDGCACALPVETPPATPVAPDTHKTNWDLPRANLAAAQLPPILPTLVEPTIRGPQSLGWDLTRRPEPRLCIWRT